MSSQAPNDASLVQNNQMTELSAEDILKQIFGDVGELIEGQY